jgi:hypothetical protein
MFIIKIQGQFYSLVYPMLTILILWNTNHELDLLWTFIYDLLFSTDDWACILLYVNKIKTLNDLTKSFD